MTSAKPARRRGPLQWFARGGWYFAVVLLSFGILSPIPFAHAATRLRGIHWDWPVVYIVAVVTLLSQPSPVSNLVAGLVVGRCWPRSCT